MTENFLFISGHDYRSKRWANVHFIARELRTRGKVRFFSCGFSALSKIKQDPRLSLWDEAGRVDDLDGVDCYLWRTMLHPINLGRLRLSALEGPWFGLYARRAPPILRKWIGEADTVIVESGMGIVFFDLIKTFNPAARTIYLASDTLDTIGCARYLQQKLSRAAPLFDSIVPCSEKMSDEFPEGSKIIIVPHGIDMEALATEKASPYSQGRHLVSVGSMLFDPSFFEIAAAAFPDITFHVIGAGKRADRLKAPNIRVYDEMPFGETLPYLKHADAGIAPYEGNKVAPYLVDTSMKLMQFGVLGLPAICPAVAAGNHKGRFGYLPSDRASILDAINAALIFGRFEGAAPPSWEETTQRIIAGPKDKKAG